MPNASFGVDISSFKSGISSAKQEVKTLDQQMKMLNATIKAEGQSETTLNQQTETLNKKMAAQKVMAKQAEEALKAMTEKGVKPTSDAYQKMAQDLLKAQTGMMETQAELNELTEGTIKAAAGAEALEKGMNGISKKISLDQVISGVGKITDGLESAARKAVQLGETIWTNVMDAAKWGDDIATQAMMAQMGVEEYQKIVNVAAKNGETSTASMIKSWKKVKMNLTSDSKDVVSAFNELNIKTRQWGDAQESGPSLIARDYMDVWWETGEALMKVTDAAKQERLAQTLLGRSWQESLPMFLMGRDAYEKALENEDVLAGNKVNNLGTLYDTVTGVTQKFELLRDTLIAEIAPTLTDVAGSIGDILHEVNEYLKTDEGQQALKDMGASIGKLFEGLGQLSAEDVVAGFKNVFDKIVNGLQWLADNGDKVVGIVEGLGIAWAGLKIGEGALTILKIIQGISGLGGGAAAAAGEAAGNAWGVGFASAVAKAAPWLIAIYTALNPSGTGDEIGNNTLVDANGNLTNEAIKYGYSKNENGDVIQDRTQIVSEAAQAAWDLYRTNQLTGAGMEELRQKVLNDNMYKELINQFWRTRQENPENWMNIEDIDLTEWMKGIEPPKVEIDPEAPSDAAADIAAQIGTVTVYVEPIIGDLVNNTDKRRRNAGIIPGYANGIAYVPETRLAILHRGETVTPAREVASRNYTSNLYVENMNMGGGADARGLADEMAAAQRRQASGYGG